MLEEPKEKRTDLGKPKPRRRTSRKTDQLGTSEQEQAIFYNVKQFFEDTVNRAKIENSSGQLIEADIYIPCIKVAIEYDGKIWHKNKCQQDNLKNEALNALGIYLIRVRDFGLPELDPFDGMVIYHGKSPNGKHMDQIITEIIHELSLFLPKEKRSELQSFELTYEGYLEQRPNIEALLFKEYKENNFTKHPCFQYWDYKKNGDLKPENLDLYSSAFAWFICPKGDSIIRIIQRLSEENDIRSSYNMMEEYCIFSICPFLPMDKQLAHGIDCGKRCLYVEHRFLKIIDDYLKNGIYKTKLDMHTMMMLRYYPRATFKIIAKLTYSSGDELDALEKAFFTTRSGSKNYTGIASSLVYFVKLDSVDEISVLLDFNKKYPAAAMYFNWDIFDVDRESWAVLINYFEELYKINPQMQLDPFIRYCRCTVGDELRIMINDFAEMKHIKLSPGIYNNETYTNNI